VTQIKWLVGALVMILIDSGLELAPNLEQLAIAWPVVEQQPGKAAQLMQRLGYPQTADPGVIHI